MHFIMTNSERKDVLRVVGLTIYYLFIILTLLWMEMNGSFEMPKFIYQGF